MARRGDETALLEVGAVHRQDGAGRLSAPGGSRRGGCGWWCRLLRRAPLSAEDVGNAKGAADLDQLAARDDHVASRGMRGEHENQRGGGVVHHQRVLRAGECRSRARQWLERVPGRRWKDRTRGWSSRRPRRPWRRWRRRREGRGQGGMEDDAGGVDDRPSAARRSSPRRDATSSAQSSGAPARRVRAASIDARTAESTALRDDASTALRRPAHATAGRPKETVAGGRSDRFLRGFVSESLPGEENRWVGQRIAVRSESVCSRLGIVSTPVTSPDTPLTLRTPRISSWYLASGFHGAGTRTTS